MRKYYPCITSEVLIPLYVFRVRAGFPSPADDYIDKPLDLHQHLIRHPSATYYVRAQGDSMVNFGIFDGDLLVVDRSLDPVHGDIVIAALSGELTCKVLDLQNSKLISGNDVYLPIELNEESDLIIEGVVSSSVRYHRVCPH